MEKGMKWNIVGGQIMVKFMSIVCSANIVQSKMFWHAI